MNTQPQQERHNPMTERHTPEEALEQAMSLNPGDGVVPEAQRNAGYAKLGVAPGELGIGQSPKKDKPAGSGEMEAFLAGVAAGADPSELAKQLRSTKPKRGRR